MIKEKNKLKIFIISIFILTAVIYNSLNFLVFFYNTIWNLSFLKWNYWLSVIYHQKSLNELWNEIFNYNLWWDYYKLWKYDKSLELYSKVNLFTGSNLSFDTYYNLWNNLYRLWEQEQNDIQRKVDLWKKSLLSYNQILLKKEDKKARENYNFVLKKLNEILKKTKEEQQKQMEQQQKQQEEQEKQQDTNNSKDKETGSGSQSKTEWQDNKNEKQNESNSESQKDKNSEQNNQQQVQTVQWWRGEEYKIWDNQNIQQLTEQEKQDLEKYNEQLKKDQQQNSIYFGKKTQWNNNSNSMIDMFMQDPFFNDLKSFDDSILNKNEKDW